MKRNTVSIENFKSNEITNIQNIYGGRKNTPEEQAEIDKALKELMEADIDL